MEREADIQGAYPTGALLAGRMQLMPDGDVSGGGGAITEQAGEAEIPEGEVVTEQPEASQPPAQDWGTQALPEGHWARDKGAQTWGELDQTYRSGSDEARRLNESVQEYRRIIGAYNDYVKKFQASQPQAPVPGKTYLPGFNDKAAWDAGMAADPSGTFRKAVLASLKDDPQFAKDMIAPHIEPLREEQMLNLRRQQGSDLAQRYPELTNRQSPENAVSARWINENQELFGALAQMPNVHLPEVVFKLATYDLLRQKASAGEQQQARRRSTAGSARPGTGNRAAPKNATWEDKMARLAAEHEGIPEEVLKAAAEMGAVA